MNNIVSFFIYSYGLFCTVLIYIWWKWPVYKALEESNEPKKITVIIPVRNEAENIIDLLTDIENQSLEKNNFEVIVANDESTDNTAKLVLSFISKTSLNLKFVNLPPKQNNTSPKKRAISHCISLAEGDIIVTTDGDCNVEPNWLKTISCYFDSNDVVFLSSPVFFHDYNGDNLMQRIWTKIQQIEFASLIISGAVSMKKGFPNMCSGANIAYLKSAFHAVNGFDGNEEVASGDDEFLMHKMSKAFPEKVHYLKSEEVIVKTKALPDLKSFYNQRKRWAGKWSFYTLLSPKVTAFFVFCANASFVYSLFTGSGELIFAKIWPEFLFLASALLFFKSFKLLFYIPLVQLIYPFYVLFFGLISLRKKPYNWKNRELQ